MKAASVLSLFAFHVFTVSAAGVGLAVGSSPSQTCSSIEVRKEWRALSKAERKAWIDAVNVSLPHSTSHILITIEPYAISVLKQKAPLRQTGPSGQHHELLGNFRPSSIFPCPFRPRFLTHKIQCVDRACDREFNLLR